MAMTVATKKQHFQLLNKYLKKQQKILEQLLLLLSYYEDYSHMKKLISKLGRCWNEYNDISDPMALKDMTLVLNTIRQIRIYMNANIGLKKVKK